MVQFIKTFLVPVLFPMVTTFETVGTYKKWLWPNSAHITYAWHVATIMPTSIHIYIYTYTAPDRICTPLIVSRLLRSLANYSKVTIAESKLVARVSMSNTYVWLQRIYSCLLPSFLRLDPLPLAMCIVVRCYV